MNLWTARLVELNPTTQQDKSGAEKKVFTRGDSRRCALASDTAFWKATIAGPIETDTPIVVCPVQPASDYVEYPADSGDVYRVISRRVVHHACLRVVFLALERIIGAEVRDV